jgi:hypothetical protein
MKTDQAQTRFPTFRRAWAGLLHLDLPGRLYFLAALTGMLTVLSTDGPNDNYGITIAFGMICCALLLCATSLHIYDRHEKRRK